MEYAENRLQVGLHRARHVFDEMTSWQPCTERAPPWLPRVQALCHALPSAPAPQTKRPSCSFTHSPLHSPFLALWCRTRAPGRVAIDAAASSSWPPSFFHPRAPGSHASTVTGSVVLSWSSRASPRLSFVAVERGRTTAMAAVRLLTWPASLGPLWGKPLAPAGVRGSLDASPPFAAAGEPSPVATGRFPAILCSCFRPGTSRSNSTKGRGVTAMS
jgi:hypothetical protein